MKLPLSMLQRVLDHVFPKAPDFQVLLAEQAVQAEASVAELVAYMQSGEDSDAARIKRDEHVADQLKVRNLHQLNEAFTTPFDREDIYRAIMNLDEVVNYCKSTVNEMSALGVTPDRFTLGMAQCLLEGVQALSAGFARLGKQTPAAAEDAARARKAERHAEKLYRKALAELFTGDDYLNMFKRREIYRHLSNAADRMANCANTLHDIVVKSG